MNRFEDKYNYLQEVFETLIVRDIQQKYKIKNLPLLDMLNDFLVDNISSEISSRNVANTLTSKGSKVDDKTVSSYIKYLCASYAFYKIRRYEGILVCDIAEWLLGVGSKTQNGLPVGL